MSYACITFESYDQSVAKVLDEINTPDSIRKYSKILIKPNLVNTSPHPVTTHPKMCEALINVITSYSIHYTKLYDMQSFGTQLIIRDFNSVQFSGFQSFSGASTSSSYRLRRIRARITSYNVCYTKLLRSNTAPSLASVAIAVVSGRDLIA